MSERTDNAALAQIIDNLFMLSLDDRLDPVTRNHAGHLAEHLRGQLMVLLSKSFDEGTPELEEANKKIKAVNASLKQFAEDLAGIADTFEQLGKLVSVIDGLLKVPLVFV